MLYCNLISCEHCHQNIFESLNKKWRHIYIYIYYIIPQNLPTSSKSSHIPNLRVLEPGLFIHFFEQKNPSFFADLQAVPGHAGDFARRGHQSTRGRTHLRASVEFRSVARRRVLTTRHNKKVVLCQDMTEKTIVKNINVCWNWWINLRNVMKLSLMVCSSQLIL